MKGKVFSAMKETKLKGVVSVLSAASLWALSGISGQILFEKYHFSASWIVSVRLLIAGIILLAFCSLRESCWEIFKNRRDLFSLLCFAVLGMYLVQFTYFKTIELSSASFATIIQYTGPFFIIIYEALRTRTWPRPLSLFLMVLTFLGIILLTTKGDLSNLSIDLAALFWGVGSAVTLAFYTLQPQKLLKKYSSLCVVGWGMLLGSIPANMFHPLFQIDGVINRASLLHIAMIVVFGTAIAYLIYLSSLKYLRPALASVLTAFEPILATILTVVLFHQGLSISEILGLVIVLGAIYRLQQLGI